MIQRLPGIMVDDDDDNNDGDDFHFTCLLGKYHRDL